MSEATPLWGLKEKDFDKVMDSAPGDLIKLSDGTTFSHLLAFDKTPINAKLPIGRFASYVHTADQVEQVIIKFLAGCNEHLAYPGHKPNPVTNLLVMLAQKAIDDYKKQLVFKKPTGDFDLDATFALIRDTASVESCIRLERYCRSRAAGCKSMSGEEALLLIASGLRAVLLHEAEQERQ